MNWLRAIGRRLRHDEHDEPEPLAEPSAAALIDNLAANLQFIAEAILSLPIAVTGDVLNRTDQIEETAEWLREVARELALIEPNPPPVGGGSDGRIYHRG